MLLSIKSFFLKKKNKKHRNTVSREKFLVNPIEFCLTAEERAGKSNCNQCQTLSRFCNFPLIDLVMLSDF